MKTCPTCGTEYADDVRFCAADGTTLRSTGTDIVGSIVADRYHIIKKLGEGGMGAVYLGEHVKMGRKSAIKVITQAMAQDAEAIARFNREAANAARITHQNVCGIYDFGETEDGLIYLAMEFIEGEALTALLDREGALTPRRAGLILKQTAAALQAAHELGIVHRDLKPDNIMIARNRDGGDLVKVVDFGIAKAMGSDSEQKVTKTGLVVGTPEYMSPEQLSGDQLDGRSDIYSLALVLFRMLTGQLPFQAGTSQEVMIKRLTDEPMRLVEALPGTQFPDALQRAMDHALERMPADRYTKAAEFGRDVAIAVSAMPDVAPKVDTEGATQMFDGVGPGATAALPDTHVRDATAGTAATVAAAAAPTARPAAPPVVAPTTAAPRHAAPARRKSPALAIAIVAIVLGGGGGTAAWLLRGTDDPAAGGSEAVPETGTGVTGNTASQREAADVAQGGGDRPSTRIMPVTPPGNQASTDPTAENGGEAGTEAAPAEPDRRPRGIVVSTADAMDRVIDLLVNIEGVSDESVLRATIDTATAYYQDRGVATKARADAAFVIANAYAGLGTLSEAVAWAERAIALDSTDRAYQDLLARLRAGSRV